MPKFAEEIAGKRGKFLKRERRTFTESVMLREKKKPAPSKYYDKNNKMKFENTMKVKGQYVYKERRINQMDNKKWLAMQVPPVATYKNVEIAKDKV